MTTLLTALALASAMTAHDPEWSNVRHLKPGAEVIVMRQDGSRPVSYSDVTRVVAATDAALIVAPLGPRAAVIRILRDDVASVTLRREKTRGSPEERVRAGLFAFLMTAIGAAGGGTGPNFCTEHPRGCLPVSLIGGVLGVVAGYFGGKSERIVELTVIYRATRVY
ncbi:MAG TPA: hypothetical protein VKH42_18625 [Vicinamibacterales bacterium]|nr:hypothetical protein [Vicinamibacterales bacterium]